MNRLVIMTVGKTHSGKTTFAEALEKELHNSVVIDQDNHAEFLHTYYQPLLPKNGPNLIKYALTQTIVEYAVNETDMKRLEHFHEKGFTSILVHFDISEHILKERIAKSNRSTTVLRTASTFEEVLTRQEKEINKDVIAPINGEANLLFVINHPDEVQSVINRIVKIARPN
jgi:deoxyadenosine/deoxycytidine kinase